MYAIVNSEVVGLAPAFQNSEMIIFAMISVATRVARFFLVHDTKTGKNVTNGHKISPMTVKYSKWP
jgi:hypothetical protein